MGRRVICSRSHSFELPGGDGIQLTDFPVLCPVCGVVVADSAKELNELAHKDVLPDTDPEIDLPPEPAPARVSLGLPVPARYEVIQLLGQGGMGSVFKAVDKYLDRIVALKMHAPLSHEDPAHRARLRQRTRAAVGLMHPHFVSVFDYGEQDGWLWEAQEFMEGGDLTRLLRHGPLLPSHAVRLLVPVTLAVQYLHERGYVHRDLKPRKVLLTADGRPKLADLDLAKRLDEDAEEPTGTIVGTPRYMAPEQWQGDNAAIGPAADIYGLGAILYETLTGRPPVQGASPAEVAQQAMSAEPIPPSRLQPAVPRDLETICLRCLEKDPRRRYASAADLAEALARFAKGTNPALYAAVPCASISAPNVVCPTCRKAFALPPDPVGKNITCPACGAGFTVGKRSPLPKKEAYPSVACRTQPIEAHSIDLPPSPLVLPITPHRRTGPGLWERLRTWFCRRLRVGKTARDQVDATVFAPPAVQPGHQFLVQVFAHLPTQGDQARELASEFDQQAERRGVTSLELEIARGERLIFHLTMPGLAIDRPQADLIWRGRPGSVQFDVRVPLGHVAGTVVGTVTASLQSVPVGHVKFKLTVAQATSPANSTEPVATGESALRYRHAFISYASADRKEVLKRVQMLARLHISFFQDILDLDPGVRWQRELYRHIDQSDLFLLFWSTPAQESKWVLEEVRYALKRKGDNDLAPPEILPIVIEGPPPPPPPDELAHLHFNDYLLYLMQEPSGQQ